MLQISVTDNGLAMKVVDGAGATVTTPSGQVVEVGPGEMVTVSPTGVVTGPVPAPNNIVDFAGLEPGTTVTVDVPPALLGVVLAGGIAGGVIAIQGNGSSTPASP